MWNAVIGVDRSAPGNSSVGGRTIPLRHRAERAEKPVRRTEPDRDGHFAAVAEPDLLVGDVRAFFRELRRKQAG
ncbi:hypothetical protein SUDANB176_00709 [Streptomyces sp. enrichment culture]